MRGRRRARTSLPCRSSVWLVSLDLGVTPSRRQDLDIKDTGVPMLLGRFETERLPFKLRLDAGWMEGDFGDLDGRFLDLSVTAHYRIQKGIWGWIGYWRYDLPFQGTEGGLAYDFDATLQGWIAGVRFEL